MRQSSPNRPGSVHARPGSSAPTVYCATCRRYSQASIPAAPVPVKTERSAPACPHCAARTLYRVELL